VKRKKIELYNRWRCLKETKQSVDGDDTKIMHLLFFSVSNKNIFKFKKAANTRTCSDMYCVKIKKKIPDQQAELFKRRENTTYLLRK